MLCAACDDNSLPRSRAHVPPPPPPAGCGCPGLGWLQCSTARFGDKSCTRGPSRGLGFVLSFPECPVMTAGCGDALALCGEGDGRWEYLSTWATAGAASVPRLRRGKQAAALLEKGRVEDFSVSTCTHQYEPLRAAMKFPSFLPRCSLLKNAFRYKKYDWLELCANKAHGHMSQG